MKRLPIKTEPLDPKKWWELVRWAKESDTGGNCRDYLNEKQLKELEVEPHEGQ